MREGQNPAKFVQQIGKPEKITVAVLAHIPFLSGFYAHTLDVLKECLGSLWRTTGLPYDLLVFDNGSCKEAVDFLREAHQDGRIQFLVLSEKNIGKGGAWNFIIQFAPGEVLGHRRALEQFGGVAAAEDQPGQRTAHCPVLVPGRRHVTDRDLEPRQCQLRGLEVLLDLRLALL